MIKCPERWIFTLKSSKLSPGGAGLTTSVFLKCWKQQGKKDRLLRWPEWQRVFLWNQESYFHFHLKIHNSLYVVSRKFLQMEVAPAEKVRSVGLYIDAHIMPAGGARVCLGTGGREGERKKWKENGNKIKLFSVPVSSYKPKMAHYV